MQFPLPWGALPGCRSTRWMIGSEEKGYLSVWLPWLPLRLHPYQLHITQNFGGASGDVSGEV